MESWRDFEHAGWESHVAPYHSFFGPICAQLADPLLDAVAAGPGSRLLDACCGPGYVAGRAAERGSSVEGIDIAAGMIELARRLYPAVHFRVGDAEDLPYADGEFDAVVCNIGLHHLTSPQRGVAEFARVMASSGRLSLSVWDDASSALGIIPDAVATAGAVSPDDLPCPPAGASYDTVEELGPLLDAAGFGLNSLQAVSFLQRYPTRQALWDGWLSAAIRTGPLLAAQSPEIQTAARRAFDHAVAAFMNSDGEVEIPVGFLMVTATKWR